MPSSPQSITAIVAATLSNGIGLNGGLPWRLPGEMKYFARVTSGEDLPESSNNAVIMGRKTWESIPPKFRPLKGRRNLIISAKGVDLSGEALSSVHSSLPSAVSSLDAATTPKAFLIGGAQLYTQGLEPSTPLVKRILLTRVLSPDFKCDTFLTDFQAQKDGSGQSIWRQATHQALCEYIGFEVTDAEVEEKGVKYRYEMWERS